MGFNGTYLVARSERPLRELASVTAAGGEPCRSAADREWRLVQVLGGGEPGRSLAAETGAPVLVASVLDGDVVVVTGSGPDAPGWEGVLAPEMALEYGFTEDLLGDPQEVAAAAAAWARSIGREPDQAVLADILADDGSDAEDAFHDLLSALGFAFTDDASDDVPGSDASA